MCLNREEGLAEQRVEELRRGWTGKRGSAKLGGNLLFNHYASHEKFP
jgi:hypothetical protein